MRLDTTSRINLPDRFQLDGEIGRGGMAVVYRAHDRHLDRHVAIKVLSADLSSVVSAERFQREIAMTAGLVHPGIVALFDSGEIGGQLYYVMPFVAGDTLRARLTREQRLTMEDVAEFGADVAEALAYAHGQGIVHRDVKPENVFAVGGRALLADFGIARLVGAGGGGREALTTIGMVMGTTAYMSPEQASGETSIDGRSDLYSLGCVLYELLTGVPPFTAPTPMAVLAKHLTETPRRPNEHGVRLSPAMDAIIMQLLAKEPDERPANAGEVARALRVAPRTRVAPASAPSRASRTVAVGSMVTSGGDRSTDALAGAITNAIVSSLGAAPDVRVLLPTADDARGDARAVAAATGAALVVEGSIRRSGARVRATLRGISADGEVQWSQHLEGTTDDLFALEDAASSAITQRFTTTSGPAPTGDAPVVDENSTAGRAIAEADRLAREGMKALRRGMQGGPQARAPLEEANRYFQRAHALDPNNARAVYGLAQWCFSIGWRDAPNAEAEIEKGRQLLFRAQALDDHVAEVQCGLGVYALYWTDDFHGAERYIRRALELDPVQPDALRLQGVIYKILGRVDDAVDAMRAAIDRAPDSPALWNGLGDALLAAGRNAEAIDALKQAIALMPGYAAALERFELALYRSGEVDRALEVRESRMRLAGQGERADLLAREVDSFGAAAARRRDAERELETLLREAETVDPFGQHQSARSLADRIVMTYAELGEWHKAMDWVERSYVHHPGRLRRMVTDHPFDRRGLATDPRYARLMRVTGMEELL